MRCCVPFCSNRTRKSTGSLVRFHRFPADEELCRLWLMVINHKLARTEPFCKETVQNLRVCSDHFSPFDYKQGLQREILKPSALPCYYVRINPQTSQYEPQIPEYQTVTIDDEECKPSNEELCHYQEATPDSDNEDEVNSKAEMCHLQEPTLNTITDEDEDDYDEDDVDDDYEDEEKDDSKSSYVVLSHLPEPAQTLPAMSSQMTSAQVKTIVVPQNSRREAATTTTTATSSEFTFVHSSSSSCSASTQHNGWSERKWIVNEANLLQLFTVCQQCGSAITDKDIKYTDNQIKISWTCANNHFDIWTSC